MTFEEFYSIYPRKRDRYKAERAWKRLNKRDREAAVSGLELFLAGKRETRESIPYLSTYLNNKRWTDGEDVKPAQRNLLGLGPGAENRNERFEPVRDNKELNDWLEIVKETLLITGRMRPAEGARRRSEVAERLCQEAGIKFSELQFQRTLVHYNLLNRRD